MTTDRRTAPHAVVLTGAGAGLGRGPGSPPGPDGACARPARQPERARPGIRPDLREPAVPVNGVRRTVPTVGVEEEFLLVDRRSRLPVPRAPQVLAASAAALGGQVQPEFLQAQVETCTRPALRLKELRDDLARLRAVLVAAAADAGCLLVASGTPVLTGPGAAVLTENPRYRRMAARYPGAVDGWGGALCGCHIHLGTVDRGLALALGNRLRPWLPVLQALAVNSPFDGGRDSGFASWRTVRLARWPTVGPAPVLDEPGYEALADSLVARGTLLDRRMIYWYTRPSEHLPTLEVRITDVNADLDTVLLLAGLLRGLASVLLEEARAGVPAPGVPPERLTAAHRRAARTGPDGGGLDPFTGRPVPMAALVDRLLDRAAPGLAAAGDLPAAEAGLDRLRRLGTGAERQRRHYLLRHRPADVVDALARQTAALPPAD
ncbi:carboxylate-amine ligase [Streptomyces sp. TLI_053]|uniref:carboxylate-amine ligase n=1 Tax=Streptomyces sp. TLI_053 TaxID=1855352 RepID=UPI000879A7E4|nr:glutamate--cysteine ligase [Streptomyces sp. TLI_053]SDT82848.1 carboxylate-amine ligase [Streptomyces sp. TLI_053]